MVRYIIIHLIFICFSIQAQDRVLDSLQNILSSSIHDTDKVKIILEIVSKTVVNNPSEAIKYADSALSVSQRTGYKKGIGESYISIKSQRPIIPSHSFRAIIRSNPQGKLVYRKNN